MKIALSTYSLERLIRWGTLTQFDCIQQAKSMGFDAIEFADIIAPAGASKQEYAKILAEECKKVGLPVSSLAFSADFLNGSGGDVRTEIEKVKKMLEIAEILEAKFIRHDATTGDGRAFDEVLPLLADACREITEHAMKKGIQTTVENHGFFCQDSERMEKLYHAVNHPNFGLLADMGNFLCADEAPDAAFKRVSPYATYVHAKDFFVTPANAASPGEGYFKSRNGNYLKGAIIGHGDVPIQACLKLLKKTRYEGYIAIEFEGQGEPFAGVFAGLSNLKRYLSEIEK